MKPVPNPGEKLNVSSATVAHRTTDLKSSEIQILENHEDVLLDPDFSEAARK